MARVAVYGATGRMGRAVIASLAESKTLSLGAAIEEHDARFLGVDAGVLAGCGHLGVLVVRDLEPALAACDIAIDFTRPTGTLRLAQACAHARVAAVVGTTGLDTAAESALDGLATVVPVVAAPNMSIGVTVLCEVARVATTLLGDDFDAEIIEMHHRHKVDAPSGTAKRLLEVVAEAKRRPTSVARYGRSDVIGPRTHEEIGVLALRGGDVIGDHTLVLAGEGERLELTHRAHGRQIFARGALRAAEFCLERPAGRYSMRDVLGL